MKRYFNRQLYLIYFFCFLLSTLTACKKLTTELPGNVPATALNFYSATDVMIAAYGNVALTTVQVDNFITPYKTGTNLSIPELSAGGEFPTVDGGFMNFANYKYKADGHSLFFTDTGNVVVLDTLINPAPKSYTCVYLADVPVSEQNTKAAYRMLAVNEERKEIPPGKVGIRLVHLGPDAGSLDCSLFKADGSLTSLLLDKLNYGQATPYLYLDSSAVATGLIKLSLNNATTGVAITTGFPFSPGHSYAIVISGFSTDQQRQIRSGTNPDGSVKYTSVNISRNLRAIVRKTY